MALPWNIIETVTTPEGPLELRQRGAELLITIAGRVLMTTHRNRSELALARLACGRITAARPRVLFGGLGLGHTLRAGLDTLPADAEVVVAELNPVVVRWCRGPAASATSAAVDDPRVEVVVGDVADVISEAARSKKKDQRYDAIILDLYEGPNHRRQGSCDPFYGTQALQRSRRALRAGGVLAVWSEEPDPAFGRRLVREGFTVELKRFGRGASGHAVYLASL